MKLVFYFSLLQFLIFTPEIIAHNLSSSYNVPISFRIPSTTKPDHYSIKLHINSTDNDRIFYGETNITIDVMAPTNVLYLHAVRIIISEINLTSNNGSIVRPFNYSINITTEVLTVKFVETISLGKCILNIIYTGAINDNRQGLMRGSYTENDNKLAYFIASQLLPTGARDIFPCWDIPALKANFTIIVKHETRYTPVSNMHVIKIERDEQDPRMQTTIFANTPKMSTSSVAIVISNLTYHSSNDGAIKVWSTNSTMNKIKYTVDIIPKILDKLKKFTNISYADMGFKKMDIIALPYKGGIMESWGLITIFENSIAIDDPVTDSVTTENEIVHLCDVCAKQWFGNLVSSAQQSDSWFNDGVVAYLKFFLTEQIMPAWHMMDRMAVEMSMSATLYSGSQYSNAQNFLTLLQKSVNIIYTSSRIFGDGNLRKAFQKYVHDHAFQTATFNDFIDAWNSVADDSEKSISLILNNWISTPGFSVISVQRNYTVGTAVISQQRYLTDRDDGNADYNKNYWVPINYVTYDNINSANFTSIRWLNPTNRSIEIGGLKNDDYLILHKHHFGYYCPNYDIKNWQLIIKALKSNNHGDIDVCDRIDLLNSAMMLISIGQLNYSTLMSLIGYLENEIDVLPWITTYRIFLDLKMKLFSTKYYIPFMEYISKLPNKLVEKIGFDELENDDHTIKLYRNSLMSMSCAWGAPSCINKAVELLTKHLNDAKKYTIPPQLRRVIFCNGIRGGNQNVWKLMMHKWLITNEPEILHALACSLNKTNLHELLSKTLVPDTDEMTVKMIFDAVRYGSNFGQDIAIDFTIKNWESIKLTYRRIVLYSVAVFISQKPHFEKIYHFVTLHDDLRNDVEINNMVFLHLKQRFANYDSEIPELDEFFHNYNLNQKYANVTPSAIVQLLR